MHEAQILYHLSEITGIQNSYSRTAIKVVDIIRVYANGDDGRLRYKGQGMRSLFKLWNEYQRDMTPIQEAYRTSDEVNQFIKEQGTTLFNMAKKRPPETELSDYEVEGVRKWMIKIAPQMY